MLLNSRPRLNYQCEAVKDYNKNLLKKISKTYRMENNPEILKKKKKKKKEKEEEEMFP